MRTIGLTCSAIIFLALPLAAQTPPAATPPTPPPPAEHLEQLLKGWEVKMGNIDTFATRVTRIDRSPITQKPTTYIGEAAFMKPNLAKIDLTHQDEVGKKDSEKTNFERLICNGQKIFEYVPKEKMIVIHEMPKGNNPADDNLILSFMKGMKVAAAKQRFTFVLTKETEWYSYVMIAPKSDADKQEFALAQLTIWAKNPNPQGQPDISMLPVRVWYKQPNGKEVTYTFIDMKPNANLNRASFAPVGIPGYSSKMAAAPGANPPVANNPAKPPTTYRPQQTP